MKQEKKQRHNQMEKKRKDKIKIGINHIGSLLPSAYRNTQKEVRLLQGYLTNSIH